MCLDETIAVARPAVGKIDGVDHLIAIHRIGIGNRLVERIWTVAHVGAVQFRRDAACDDRQIGCIDLGADRGEVSTEMRIIGGPGDIRRLQGRCRTGTQAQTCDSRAGGQKFVEASPRHAVDHFCLHCCGIHWAGFYARLVEIGAAIALWPASRRCSHSSANPNRGMKMSVQKMMPALPGAKLCAVII